LAILSQSVVVGWIVGARSGLEIHSDSASSSTACGFPVIAAGQRGRKARWSGIPDGTAYGRAAPTDFRPGEHAPWSFIINASRFSKIRGSCGLDDDVVRVFDGENRSFDAGLWVQILLPWIVICHKAFLKKHLPGLPIWQLGLICSRWC
jgi:hypothetical protein